jgi:hypothetical protein
MALTPHQVKLGYDVIIYGGAGLYLVYTFWRSRGKNWGYWETRWRLIPSGVGLPLLADTTDVRMENIHELIRGVTHPARSEEWGQHTQRCHPERSAEGA